MHVLGGKVAIGEFSGSYHATITKTLNFVLVRLSGFTVPCVMSAAIETLYVNYL